MQLAN